MARKLENGWEIVALNTRGNIREVKHKNVTDSQISKADTIYVSTIGPSGLRSYRGIHGADDIESVEYIIDTVISSVSAAV